MRRTNIIYTVLLFFISLGLLAQQPERDYLEGVASYMKGDYQKGTSCFDRLIGKDPGNTGYLQMRAACLCKFGNYEAAIKDLQSADKVQPGSVDYELARMYALSGNREKAVSYLRRNLESTKRKPESEIKLDKAFISLESTKEWKEIWLSDWYNRVEMTEADIRYLLKSGDNMDALTKLNELISKNKKRAGWYFLRAKAYEQLQEYNLAIEDINRAISLNKRQGEYFVTRAALFQKKGKWEKSAEDYERALKLDASELLLYRESSRAWCMAGEAKKGLEKITLYIELFPKDPEGYLISGMIDYALSAYTQGIEKLNIAIGLDASRPEYFYQRGMTYLELMKFRDAINDFAQALDLDADNTDAWYRKGMARLYIGDTEGACTDLKKAGKMGHKDAFNKAAEVCP